MAATVAPLPQVRLPHSSVHLSEDQNYWASFSQSLIPTANSPITHLSSAAQYIAVTTSSRLQLLSSQTLKSLRTISRNISPLHGASVRRDGRLCIVGTDSGTVQVFDTASRAILKTWNDHKQPVWVTKWHARELTNVLTCSDDRSVRLWDLPAEHSSWVGWGHGDYVRCGETLDNGNLIVSGSYDQTIRLWDTRRDSKREHGSNVMQFKLSAPVEAVLPLPGGTTIVGAAGEKMAVLDLVAARPLHLLRSHQKTVTSLALGSQGSRVLSGALDGHVKVFDRSAWKVVAGLKYPSPVLSLALVSASTLDEDRHLCVGMQSGLLSVRTRLSGAAKAARRAKEKEMAALMAGSIEKYDRKQKKRKMTQGWEKRFRGRDYLGEDADLVVDLGRGPRRKRLTPWEKEIHRGDYASALDLAMDTRDSTVILTLLKALVHRSALRTAISGRKSPTDMLPLLAWLIRNIEDPRFVRTTTDVAMVLLDVYSPRLGDFPEFDNAVWELQEGVQRGAEVAQVCGSTAGMLDMLAMAGARETRG